MEEALPFGKSVTETLLFLILSVHYNNSDYYLSTEFSYTHADVELYFLDTCQPLFLHEP